MERIIRDSDDSLLDHIVYLDVVARVTQGDFEPASDVGEGAWFTKEELTRIRAEIHEDTQRLLTEAGLLPKL
ncbi:MAG: hypothetical protein ACFFDE_11105 [Promethearchaeota archaeon]